MKAIIRLTMVLVAAMGVSMSTIDANPIASPTTQYDGHRGSSKGSSANRGNSRKSTASPSQSSRTTNRQSTRQQVQPSKERAVAVKNTSEVKREENRGTLTNRNVGRRPGVSSDNRRPTGNNENVGRRPGGKPDNNGNVRPNRPRPDNGDHHGHHNGHHYGHNNGHHHHYRPVPPPHRPYRPCPHIVYRPVVPVTYVPYVKAPVLNSILGLCFGYPIYDCIDILTGRGYIIDGYNANEVYLRNIRSLGYDWDDVILYYDNGGLANISFYNSVSNYSSRRYDNVYRELCRLYGTPAISSRNGLALSASWYDGGGRNFITLSLNLEKSFGGSNRYFTTVTFGSNY